MRPFLIFSAFVWAGYGLLCWVRPETVIENAELAAMSATARTELRAMYGGLQTAFGVMAIAGLMRPELARNVAMFLGASTLGLAGARLSGLALDGGASVYTVGAVIFEISATAWAFWAVRQD
jgi:hypothetical protein